MLNLRVKKDVKQRHFASKKYTESLCLKYIISSSHLIDDVDINFQSQILYSNFSNRSFTSRTKNVCVLTGKTRGIFSEWKINRMQIKRMAGLRLLPGLRSSSW